MAHSHRRNSWSRELGIASPIVCAPMGGAAGGALAAAVSVAGGLGMIGMGSTGSRAKLERELAEFETALRSINGPDGPDGPVAANGSHPSFGIGMVAWGIERDPAMLERALEAQPSLLSVSFGDWAAGGTPEWLLQAKRNGVRTITQVATLAEALTAEAAGVDAVVARGLEGGGHGDHRVPLNALLAEVVAEVSIPVLAAGAISTAHDVERVLDVGAVAAWVGTAFAACAEALTPPAAREVMIAARGSDTRVTRVFDVAIGQPWPTRFPERVIETQFVAEWLGHEQELAENEAVKQRVRAANAVSDYRVVPVNAGLGVDRITRVRSAAEVVRELAGEA